MGSLTPGKVYELHFIEDKTQKVATEDFPLGNRLCRECSTLDLGALVPEWPEEETRAPKPLLLRTSSFPLRDFCAFCHMFYETGLTNEGSMPSDGFDVWLSRGDIGLTSSDKAMVHVREHGKHETEGWMRSDPEMVICAEIGHNTKCLTREYTHESLVKGQGSSSPPYRRPGASRDHIKIKTRIPGCDFLPRLEVPAYLDRKTFGTIKAWLDACSRGHQNFCTLPTPGKGLTKIQLIDCELRALVSPGDSCPQFAALSYVWGDTLTKTAVLESLADLHLSPKALPRTIEDALQATKSLGLRYLWVDQYCINQADHRLKLAQIQLMDQIYSYADIVFIVASGSGSDDGIPGISRPRRAPARVRASNGRVFISRRHRPEKALTDSKWATRGWTFQEGLLGRRRLVFTEDEVLMECRYGLHCESELFPEQRNNSILQRRGYFFANGLELPYKLGLGEGTIMWNDNVNMLSITLATIAEYSKRNLSFDSDRLTALGGVLKLYSEHWAGLPYHIRPVRNEFFFNGRGAYSREHVLAFFLAWKHRCTASRESALSWTLKEFDAAETQAVDQRTVKRLHMTPSISWAGWTGPITFFAKTDSHVDIEPQFRLLSMQHPNALADYLQQAHLVVLEIKARMYKAVFTRHNLSNGSCQMDLYSMGRMVLSLLMPLQRAGDGPPKLDTGNVIQVSDVLWTSVLGEDEDGEDESTSGKRSTLAKRSLIDVNAVLLSKAPKTDENLVLLLVTPCSGDNWERVGIVIIKKLIPVKTEVECADQRRKKQMNEARKDLNNSAAESGDRVDESVGILEGDLRNLLKGPLQKIKLA